jgi:catechol 2,3-dioxygenase-like lactoylglutathione lyase family enzyme
MRKIQIAALSLAALGAGLCGAAQAQSQAQSAAPTAAPSAAASTPARAGLIGAAINVADLERSLKFYRDTLGMKVLMQFTPPGAPARGGQKAPPDTVLSAGKSPSDAMLMLLSDRDPAGPRAIGHVFGFARVVLSHGDLDALAARLRENGFAPGEVHKAHDAFRVMMLTDPDGYMVEIIERKG